MSVFRFKQFEVQQDDLVFKIGTDGLLLGCWTEVSPPKHILDIGTGTGLIALICAQRFPSVDIEALDLNPAAVELAKYNFEQSPWKSHLTASHTDLSHFSSDKKFDLIISNPPFFENRLKSGKSTKDLARHNDHLPFEILVQKVKELLTPNGTFSTILPLDEYQTFLEIAKQHALFPYRECVVKGNPTSSPKRVIAQFGLTQKNLKKEALTVERSRHVYTEDFIALAKDFLLKL